MPPSCIPQKVQGARTRRGSPFLAEGKSWFDDGPDYCDVESSTPDLQKRRPDESLYLNVTPP